MCHSYHNPGLHTQDWGMFINPLFIGFKFPFFQESLLMAGWPLLPQKHHLGWPRRNKSVEQCSKTPDWWDNRFLYPIPWRIHGAGIYIYGVTWIPSIYPSHVTKYSSTMDLQVGWRYFTDLFTASRMAERGWPWPLRPPFWAGVQWTVRNSQDMDGYRCRCLLIV